MTAGNDGVKITSLRELPGEIAPPRDLWSDIEREIKGRPQHVRRSRPSVWAAAAVIAAVVVGVWIGRDVFPFGRGAGEATTAQLSGQAPAGVFPAAYVLGPQYQQQRAALLKSLDARMAALPPQTRAKVVDSLQTIRRSIKDLQDALGQDPSNALLQELLVNTYQDEMRVLTTVHEASETEQGT